MFRSSIFVAAMLGFASLVSSTTVACTRSGTETEVTGGIQHACSSSKGLEYKNCNIFGYNCDFCQTIDPNSEIRVDDPIFQDTSNWCSAQQSYDSSNNRITTYRLVQFRRYGEPPLTYKRWLGQTLEEEGNVKRQGENQLQDDLQEVETTLNDIVGGDVQGAVKEAEHLLNIFKDGN